VCLPAAQAQAVQAGRKKKILGYWRSAAPTANTPTPYYVKALVWLAVCWHFSHYNEEA
jgi:hypothetical protein